MPEDATRIAESPGRWLPDDGQTAIIAGVGFDFVTFGKSAAVESIRLAVETVAKAAAKGVVEGIEAGRSKTGEGKD